MIKIALLFFCVFALLQPSFSQSCPPNIDFETGDFSNWECFTGTTSSPFGRNKIDLALSGPQANRHEIISANSAGTTALDQYGKFPQLCPYGGNHTVKLGNNSTGGEAEGLSYTFTVPTTVDTFTFTYFYAVVFEDPSHSPEEQPRFFVTAYEVATGNLINCASFNYISNGAIPGFEHSELNSSVLFKNWSPASLQFAGLGGKSVRLEFKTADCTLGGHFGYAYVDVGSACSNIMATAPYCRETNSLILNAPYGFKTYTWYNQDFSAILGSEQSLTLSPPPATTGVFYVDVIPYPGYGCRDTLHANVVPLPVPDTPVARSEYSYCQFQSVPPLTATATRGHDLFWYTSDVGGIGSTKPPVPPTSSPGTFTFYVSQKVLFGCESFRKKITVHIIPTPLTSFNTNSVRQCQSTNAFVFRSTSTNLSNSTFSWDFGNSEVLTSAKDSVVNYTYSNPGTFTVKLKITNAGTCFSEKSVAVTIIPKPIATFTYPPVICEQQTNLSIVNTSSVPAVASLINKWWWSIAGTVVSTRDPAAFIPTVPGPLPVKLVVTTEEGCSSDTNSTTILVHYRPAAAIKLSAPVCNNETIRFTNLSSIPAVSNESVVKWNWNFDNTIHSSLQNPSLHFEAATHQASLISESNFGCRSTPADSLFQIYAKPLIAININDSCVFRTINYSGEDLLSTVKNWYWDFGNGFYRSNREIIKTYNTEGYRPLTLIGETAQGCKDTVIRPFTIYDNKAVAGRDTVAAFDEPIQLNAHGGANVNYVWTPSLGLDNPGLENPVATWNKDQLYRLDAVTDKGCDSHTKIMIKRYKGPELYIPTAFTPNADGLNDVLRVFPVGIKSFNYFAVYNRLGQRIYYTTNYSEGWDGTYKGNKLDGGTYVVYAAAIDFKGRLLENKNTVILIR